MARRRFQKPTPFQEGNFWWLRVWDTSKTGSRKRQRIKLANADMPVREVQKIVDFLGSTDDTASNADWKDRFKENSDKMRTGTLFETAVVLKSLLILHHAKIVTVDKQFSIREAMAVTEGRITLAGSNDEVGGRKRRVAAGTIRCRSAASGTSASRWPP